MRPARLLPLLTALNFLNYIDHQALFAVFPEIQADLALSDADFGFLAAAFIVAYMITTPVRGVPFHSPLR